MLCVHLCIHLRVINVIGATLAVAYPVITKEYAPYPSQLRITVFIAYLLHY